MLSRSAVLQADFLFLRESGSLESEEFESRRMISLEMVHICILEKSINSYILHSDMSDDRLLNGCTKRIQPHLTHHRSFKSYHMYSFRGVNIVTS